MQRRPIAVGFRVVPASSKEPRVRTSAPICARPCCTACRIRGMMPLRRAPEAVSCGGGARGGCQGGVVGYAWGRTGAQRQHKRDL